MGDEFNNELDAPTIPKHMVSETEIQINRERVINAINFLCMSHSIPFHYVYFQPMFKEWGMKMPDLGRDGSHPGPNTHKAIAEHF